jgi:hypothetical protein
MGNDAEKSVPLCPDEPVVVPPHEQVGKRVLGNTRRIGVKKFTEDGCIIKFNGLELRVCGDFVHDAEVTAWNRQNEPLPAPWTADSRKEQAAARHSDF